MTMVRLSQAVNLAVLPSLWVAVVADNQCASEGICDETVDESTALLQSRHAVRSKNLHRTSAGNTTCYIAECGCPPFGAGVPSWCVTGDAAVNGDWCQESEDRCSQCNGYWYVDGGEGSTCVGPTPAPTPTPVTPEPSTCYIAACGCPPFGPDAPSWCSNGNAAVNGDWCQESEDRCSQCNGYWYADGGEGSTCVGPTPAPTPTPVTPETPACYIAACRCPPFGSDVPSWCSNGNAAVNGDWCQESEDRCSQCHGYWYRGPGQVPQGVEKCVAPPFPAPTPATQCFNSECGCPPFADGKSWCSEYSATMGQYCEGGEDLCEGNCKGVWCPAAGAL